MEGGRQEERRWRTSITAVAVFSLGLVAALLAPTLAQAVKPGALDPSFGGDGRVRTKFRSHEYALSTAIDRHGRILAAGTGDLIRYRRNGNLDRSFGKNGKVDTGVASTMAVGPRGRIVVGGDVLA